MAGGRKAVGALGRIRTCAPVTNDLLGSKALQRQRRADDASFHPGPAVLHVTGSQGQPPGCTRRHRRGLLPGPPDAAPLLWKRWPTLVPRDASCTDGCTTDTPRDDDTIAAGARSAKPQVNGGMGGARGGIRTPDLPITSRLRYHYATRAGGGRLGLRAGASVSEATRDLPARSRRSADGEAGHLRWCPVQGGLKREERRFEGELGRGADGQATVGLLERGGGTDGRGGPGPGLCRDGEAGGGGGPVGVSE